MNVPYEKLIYSVFEFVCHFQTLFFNIATKTSLIMDPGGLHLDWNSIGIHKL